LTVRIVVLGPGKTQRISFTTVPKRNRMLANPGVDLGSGTGMALPADIEFYRGNLRPIFDVGDAICSYIAI